MDDIVKAAMVKWPNVPDCYGWLGLDGRGNWYMRDGLTQLAGPFAGGGPGSRGSLLRHTKLIEFIERNYAADIQGQWFFQNGPQRVYVELEFTPWIWRVASDFQVTSHAGARVSPVRCLVDESGHVYLATAQGLGLVHSQDVVHIAQALEQQHWPMSDVQATQLPASYGYVPSPAGRWAERSITSR